MTIQMPIEAPPKPAPVNVLLTGTILPTLLRLAIPNSIAMFGSALVAVAETAYIGRLGTVPLAAIALVFPFVMLTQMMSAGAMGGGVSSAISRALGAGLRERASALALHAALIGTFGGLLFTVMMLTMGRWFFAALGGSGVVLEEAWRYTIVLFSGAVSIWLVNTLASVLRGTGDMRLPSLLLIAICIVQVVVGGVFGLGLFGAPQYGMAGVAAGQLIAFTLGALFLIWHLLSGRSRLTIRLTAFRFEREMFVDILRVGMISCLSPLQTVLTILIFTKLVSTYGTDVLAGYGLGSRLEFLLIPITFAIGTASVPMVGMAIGAGLVDRARRVAWIAALTSAVAVGVVGIIVALAPSLWTSMFTQNPAVQAAAASYFAFAGPAFAFFGFGVCLYFSSQGAAKVGGPVMASTLRLLIVAVGGFVLAANNAPAWTLFALVGVAMVAHGLSTALIVRLTSWSR